MAGVSGTSILIYVVNGLLGGEPPSPDKAKPRPCFDCIRMCWHRDWLRSMIRPQLRIYGRLRTLPGIMACVQYALAFPRNDARCHAHRRCSQPERLRPCIVRVFPGSFIQEIECIVRVVNLLAHDTSSLVVLQWCIRRVGRKLGRAPIPWCPNTTS